MWRPTQCRSMGTEDVACRDVTLPTPRARHGPWLQAAKATCQMHKGREGSICFPDMDIGCMQIGVWRRYLSDARARDARDQGQNSRMVREPGILGISLIYAADMCSPQSCAILDHHLPRSVHVLLLQAMCMYRYGGSGMMGVCAGCGVRGSVLVSGECF